MKKGLVPERRFPDFKDAGEWESKSFKEIYSFKSTNSLSRDKLSYRQGTVKNIHYGDIHTRFSTLLDIDKEDVPYIDDAEYQKKIKTDSYCVVGDIIFADASEDIYDIGKCIEVVSLNNQKLVSGLHTLLARPKRKIFFPGFGGYLFKSDGIRNQIEKESQGVKVLGLSGGRLSSISLAFPADEKEQQQIVCCLTSVDELITAQTKKLDALKTHKMGLMQQLFPAGSETTPTFRFPEFKDKGDWVKQKNSDLLQKVSNAVDVDPCGDYREIGIKSHGKGIFHKEPIKGKQLGNKRVFWVQNNAFVLNIVFAWELALANTTDAEVGMIASHRFPMYKARNNKAVIGFIKYFFLTNKGKELLWLASPGGAGRNKTLGQKEFENLKFFIPRLVEEQKKIADCLTSIDELIIAQSKKVEILKAHKKGLMQQLFPAMDEVDA